MDDPSIAGCSGKVAFGSHGLANSVVERHARTPRPRRAAYHCPHCRLWHVGTDMGRIKRRTSASSAHRAAVDE